VTVFTGIVTGVGRVAALTSRPGLSSLTFESPPRFARGLVRGASVAVDGVCLTVTALRGDAIDVDAIAESLAVTTLPRLSVGRRVNLERAARDGAEIGGHPLSGHIDCTATVAQVRRPVNNRVLRIAVPPPWMRYLFVKGYVAIDGVSLSVAQADRDASWFEIWLAPETLRRTTLRDKRAGDSVNLEIDRGVQVIVDTLRESLQQRLERLADRGLELLDPGTLARLPR
jgi:riboflavin synthase